MTSCEQTGPLAAQIQAANQALITRGDFHAIGAFFAPNYIAHLTDETRSGGHVLVRALMQLYQRAFPQISVQMDVLLEGVDRIAWQRTMRAKHEGPYQGIPASGREIVWRDVVTSRFSDGQIAEEWVISDLAEQLLRSRKKT